MSPLALGLDPITDDAGTAQNKIAELCTNISHQIVPYDLGTFWAVFAKDLAEQGHRSPSLFDGANSENIETVRELCDEVILEAGQTLTLSQTKENLFGLVLEGTLGLGRINEYGHHWDNVFEAGESFVLMNSITTKNAELVAIEPCRMIFLLQNHMNFIKQKNPVLAARISMNMIAVLQHKMSEWDTIHSSDEDEEIRINFVEI